MELWLIVVPRLGSSGLQACCLFHCLTVPVPGIGPSPPRGLGCYQSALWVALVVLAEVQPFVDHFLGMSSGTLLSCLDDCLIGPSPPRDLGWSQSTSRVALAVQAGIQRIADPCLGRSGTLPSFLDHSLTVPDPGIGPCLSRSLGWYQSIPRAVLAIQVEVQLIVDPCLGRNSQTLLSCLDHCSPLPVPGDGPSLPPPTWQYCGNSLCQSQDQGWTGRKRLPQSAAHHSTPKVGRWSQTHCC